MRRRIGILGGVSPMNNCHSSYLHGCELCVDIETCTHGNPKTCRTGIIRPIGLFGTNFSSIPRTRNAVWGGRQKGANAK